MSHLKLQVFNNNGLQWFIPYFLAIGVVAIPVLILEVALGSSLRGGPVLVYNVCTSQALDIVNMTWLN